MPFAGSSHRLRHNQILIVINFTAGAGVGLGRGEVADFVGNSFQGVVGGGVNFSRLFGADAEYMYYDLNLKSTVSQSQSLNSASGTYAVNKSGRHRQGAAAISVNSAPTEFSA